MNDKMNHACRFRDFHDFHSSWLPTRLDGIPNAHPNATAQLDTPSDQDRYLGSRRHTDGCPHLNGFSGRVEKKGEPHL